jgi:hypothetical protein
MSESKEKNSNLPKKGKNFYFWGFLFHFTTLQKGTNRNYSRFIYWNISAFLWRGALLQSKIEKFSKEIL